MKKNLVLILALISPLAFSQYKIPATDLNNPPKSATPTTTVSTVEEAPPQVITVKENGCTLNFSNPKSIFIQDKKRFRSMTPLEKDYDKQVIKQVVVTGSGTEVRFKKATCTNNVITLNIIPKKIQNALTHHLFRQTLTILSSFQSDREQMAELSPLRNALARNKWNQIKTEVDLYILPCEAGKCTLRVIKSEGVDKEIEINYEAGV